MDNLEHRLYLFELELSKSLKNTVIDYGTVELNLFGRIQQCSELGELCVLKTEEIQPFDYFEEAEITLSKKITHYREYEEPVRDCINCEIDLSDAQWERLETRLDQRIYEIHDLPMWELILKTPVEDYLEQVWESIEQRLFAQIDSLKSREAWEQYTKSDEVAIPVDIERFEQQLQQRLETQSSNLWEQVVKSEEVLSYSRWEEIEDQLFDRVENVVNLGKLPFWYIIENYVHTLKKHSVAAVSALLLMTGAVSYVTLSKNSAEIASVVYSLQGEAALHPELSALTEGSFQSINGGSVTFVNAHGTVSMQNESSVALEQINRKSVHYKVDFKNKPLSGRTTPANVSFLVHKKSVPDAFRVETPDYQIIVKGTYFKVEPDISGRVSTRVLEGVVKIKSRDFGDTLLYAGQSLIYDMHSNRYKIHSSGPVVSRSEIEKLPELVDLMKYGIVRVVSNQVQAEVTIDGKVYGNAPIAVKQSFGPHRITIKKRGFSGVDTTVNLKHDDGAIELVVALQKIVKPSRKTSSSTTTATATGEKNSNLPDTSELSPEIVADRMLGIDPELQKIASKNYAAAQKAELTGRWNEAISMYLEVFNSEGSSKLRKEDALFSIGKIRAERDNEPFEAKQVFLKYLALFPDGSFSGECWLRLAELELRSNPDNAIQYYNRFFEMFPMHPRIAELKNRVGVIYLQRKRYRDAIAMFRSALQNMGASRQAERFQITTNLQKAYEESGDTDSADLLKKELHAESR
ncbi:MAG: PEGA domain-containing protein [Chitinispirillaceae bacterium]|nr:PEGA domain-containing protein [Chitinispirillaceae bacterium]